MCGVEIWGMYVTACLYINYLPGNIKGVIEENPECKIFLTLLIFVIQNAFKF